MKKANLIKALLVSTLVFSGSAFASQATSNLAVTANVAANCTIATTGVSFGSYDPIVLNKTNALNGNGNVTVTCTNGSSPTITLSQGAYANTGSTDDAPLRRMNDGGANYLTYTLYQDDALASAWGNTSATGVTRSGTGSADSVTVFGSVTGGQNVPVGSYQDTVVATVTF